MGYLSSEVAAAVSDGEDRYTKPAIKHFDRPARLEEIFCLAIR